MTGRHVQLRFRTRRAIFEQENVEVPKEWSQTATNIVASEYFYGKLGTPERESSVKQLVSRVADTIADWGREDGYFGTEEDCDSFRYELTYLLLHQMASFSSQVWRNCGLWQKYGITLRGDGWYWDPETKSVKQASEAYRHPQCSACFINSVEDDLESILTQAKTEGMLFKHGTGTNLSPLRSSIETLSGGGAASGPLLFMKGSGAFPGVVESGGKAQRAANIVILNIDHPDVVEFIEAGAKEERKARERVGGGYDGSLDARSYLSIFFQNANHSVRVTDEFMQAAIKDGKWTTRKVTTGEPVETYPARELIRRVAEAAWQCGDPGLQFDATINKWHTCKASGRINASSPQSEYMFLDDSACTVASLNLMRFQAWKEHFDVERFRHAVDVMITAQEIVVDHGSYPTEKTARNSHDFRPLGLGYANLGALLTANGLAYDSRSAGKFAAFITAIMHGQAYLTSSRIAALMGPFARYEENRTSFLEVMELHREALQGAMLFRAQDIWEECVESGTKHGYRNAQVTAVAPTGTIAFMMDCATTGTRPDLRLVNYKKLVGDGLLEMMTEAVPQALWRLHYDYEKAREIAAYIGRRGTVEGAPHLKRKHLRIFDCSLKASNTRRFIRWRAHVRMMAAVQPFLSGAISETVKLPADITPGEIRQVYTRAWRLGLKAIAVYREGSTKSQPLRSAIDKKEAKVAMVPLPASEGAAIPAASEVVQTPESLRRRLPDERQALVHHFSVGGHEGYLIVGLYDDGQPGELFIRMAKAGSTIAGLMDSFGIAVSMALQYRVPLSVLCAKFSHTRFEPSGWTTVKEIGYAKSIMDYLGRWLALKFLPSDSPVTGARNGWETTPAPALLSGEGLGDREADAPACQECGAIMTRNGSCHKCSNCGSTSGGS